MFSMGLANLVNLFDPAMVILSGEQMQFDYLYAQHVFEMVRSSTIQKGHHEPEIRIHKWGDMMWAKGAAAYALEEIVRLAIDQMGNSETVA
jgi:predicted NBD/HSP70 family sugar kinase